MRATIGGRLSRNRAILMVAVAAALFSTSGLFIKILALSPFALLSARGLVAGLVMLLWLRRPTLTWSLPQVGGGLAFALTQMLFILSTRQTTAANAILLQYTAPVYVALFGTWFLGERPQRADWVTMGLIGGGMVLFFSESLSPSGLRGNIYALISGVTLAWLMLFLRKQKDGSTVETVMLGNFFAAAIGLPALLAATPTAADIGGVLYLGVLQLGISFIMLSLAIRHLTAVEAVLIQTIEPILNPVWVFLIVGEAPSLWGLAGGAVVIGAVILRSFWRAPPESALP